MSSPGTATRLNVFLSYSRDDLDFTDQLAAALGLHDFSVTIDRHGISGGEDWQTRLGNLIRDADTVVFVLSPSSARSDVCRWEVEQAVKLGKRIIPVPCRPLEGAPPPSELASLNYIFFYPEPRSPGSGFGTGQVKLVAALNTDLDWLREHTRLLQRATEWHAGGRPANRLLSGNDIAEAKAWASRRPKDAPEPTALHLDFVKASESWAAEQASQRERELAERERLVRNAEAAQRNAAEQQRKRARLRNMALVTVTIVAALAVWQAWVAEGRRVEAMQNLLVARNTASLFRVEQAREGFLSGDFVTAILLALDGMPDERGDDEFQRGRPLVEVTAATLLFAWGELRERKVLGDRNHQVKDAVLSPDGTRVLTISAFDSAAHLWDQDGKPIATLDGRALPIDRAILSTDSAFILTVSGRTAQLWDREANPLTVLTGHNDSVTSAAFSRDATRILTASRDKTARLWDEKGNLLVEFTGHSRELHSAAFSPDGNRILTASADGTARLWDRSGNPVAILPVGADWVTSAVFSVDGTRILTTTPTNPARLWDQEGNLIATLVGHRGPINNAVFSPDGVRILTASQDHTARLWDRDGKPLEILIGHTGSVRSAKYSSDGTYILTASEDGTARLWGKDGKPMTTQLGHPDSLGGHTGTVYSAVFSPDSTRILTVSEDRTARLWDPVPPKRTFIPSQNAKLQVLIDSIKQEVPRCLTPAQRERYHLPPTPPTWCTAMRKWPNYPGDPH